LNKQTKLALFIGVLVVSIGLLASAINILGDIERLNLDQERSGKSTYMSNPAGLMREDEEIEVGGATPGKLGPLFMIELPTRTRYLRRIVAINYTNGAWIPSFDSDSNNYRSGYIVPVKEGYPFTTLRAEYRIRPLTTMRGYVPTSQDVEVLKFNTSLLYYPDLQTFESLEDFQEPYWVRWRVYKFSDSTLKNTKPKISEGTLDLPSSLQNRFENLATNIVEGTNTDYEKYRAIEAYLKENYVLNEEYLSAPSMFDPVEWFLFNNKEGVSSHFNSAFVLLARSIGLPARVVQGFRVDPEAELQYIMPQQAHMYAEVEFENLGLVIFDAAPKKYMEGEVRVNKTVTVTNITGNDPIAIKGKTFRVWGIVQTYNGSAVDGPQVEILAKVNKTDVNETGILCGVDFVANGEFDIECEAPVDILVGDYNLVAHTIKNAKYKESWSDPPIKIIAPTEVSVLGPRRIYSGTNITFSGLVIDSSNGEPLPDQEVTVFYNQTEMKIITNNKGEIDYHVYFPKKGKNNITLIVKDQDYYVGSNTTFGVSVILPPPSAKGIIAIITSFPFNIIIVIGLAVGVGIVAASRRKPVDIFPMTLDEIPRKIERIGYEDNVPLRYETYEEGIVKLFNRFYVSMQRIYPYIRDTMTPREFEARIINLLPKTASEALNDLVTSYEIAMFSNLSLTEAEFIQAEATIILILELMKNGDNEEQ
jgi:transglutaminase-like putative cysteine protease